MIVSNVVVYINLRRIQGSVHWAEALEMMMHVFVMRIHARFIPKCFVTLLIVTVIFSSTSHL